MIFTPSPPALSEDMPQAAVLPKLFLFRSAYASHIEGGRGAVFSDAMSGGLREHGQWIVFDPSDPHGKATRFIDLPDGAIKARGLSTIHEGWLYVTRGRQILRAKQGQGTWSLWFEAPRPFLAFEVLGSDRVALIGLETPCPTLEKPSPPNWRMEPGRCRTTDAAFVEIWDVETQARLHQHPMPPEILDLERTVRGLQCQVFTARSQDNLLIYLEGFGHLFHLEGRKGRLERLEVPWSCLEAPYLRSLLPARPIHEGYITPGDFLPTAMTITPAPGGSFHFSYWDQPLEEALFESTAKRFAHAKGFEILRPAALPSGSREATTPYGHGIYHAFTWNPSNRKFQPFKGTPLVDPTRRSDWDTEEGRKHLNEIFISAGAFLTPDGDIQPMRTYLQRMRASYAARTHQAVPKPPGLRLDEEADKARAAAQAKPTPAPEPAESQPAAKQGDKPKAAPSPTRTTQDTKQTTAPFPTS